MFKGVLLSVLVRLFISAAIIGCLIWGGVTFYRSVADHGLKNVIERIWNGPTK